MLGSLHIKNLATIEDLEIHFQEGFSILTGETGAGKSIIIDGIKLVLGDKASPDLIRTGRAEATIEAVFRLPPPKGVAADPSLSEEGEVFIQRHLAQDLARLSRQQGELEARKREREQRLDFLGFQIKEIEAAGLHPGEWEELLAERNILKNSEKVALLVEAGLGCAYSEEGSVSAGLSRLPEGVRER